LSINGSSLIPRSNCFPLKNPSKLDGQHPVNLILLAGVPSLLCIQLIFSDQLALDFADDHREALDDLNVASDRYISDQLALVEQMRSVLRLVDLNLDRSPLHGNDSADYENAVVGDLIGIHQVLQTMQRLRLSRIDSLEEITIDLLVDCLQIVVEFINGARSPCSVLIGSDEGDVVIADGVAAEPCLDRSFRV
jgi:hypothetical protein